jgi:tRNA (guanine37-N1)-methyltransferase
LAKYDHLIFVCGRYEGIDYRREQYFQDKYPGKFFKLSLGQFITLGGEVPTMVMLEAITRLIPGVIKESRSREQESYSIKHGGNNIEAPNYTKPEIVYGYRVPKILLS